MAKIALPCKGLGYSGQIQYFESLAPRFISKIVCTVRPSRGRMVGGTIAQNKFIIACEHC